MLTVCIVCMYPSPASPEGSSTRQSTRNDQLSVIFNVLGAPDARTIETARTEEVRDVVDALPARDLGSVA